MPDFILDLGATVGCPHGGQAHTTASSARVLLGGQPAVTMANRYVLSGCALPPPPASIGPCVSGQFIGGATRVTIDGHPAVLRDSGSSCTPGGAPLLPLATQTRVTAI